MNNPKQDLREVVPNRQTADYSVLPLRIYSFRDSENHFVPYHWHDEIEILYVEKGEFLLQVNGSNHYIKEGDICLINSKDIHQLTAINDISTHHAFVFDSKIIRLEWYDRSSQDYLNPLISGKIKFPLHLSESLDVRELVIKELKEIIDAQDRNLTGWEMLARASLLKVVAVLVNHNLLEKVKKNQKDDERMILAKDIRTYIHQNYAERITLDDLSNHAHLSRQYFCKFFKNFFGKSAIEYINEYRIKKASELLVKTDDKVTSIAFSTGFENNSYFIRKFKSINDMTPTQYREENRRIKDEKGEMK